MNRKYDISLLYSYHVDQKHELFHVQQPYQFHQNLMITVVHDDIMDFVVYQQEKIYDLNFLYKMHLQYELVKTICKD